MSYEDLNGDGYFWLPDRAEHVTPGRLSYAPGLGGNISLKLMGHFGDQVEVFRAIGAEVVGGPEIDEPRDTTRVFGLVNRKKITLDGCIQAGMTMETPGALREHFIAARALIGAHLDRDKPVACTAMTVHIEGLSYFCNRSGMSLALEMPADSPAPNVLRVEYVRPEDEVYSMADGSSLELGSSWSFGHDAGAHFNLREDVYVTVRSAELSDVRQLRRRIDAIQDLLTISAGQAAALQEITIEHPDLNREVNGKSKAEQIELIEVERGAYLEAPQTIKRHGLAFGLSTIGGLDGLAEWLDLAAQRRAPLGLLTSSFYSTHMYVENRFLNICSGAEALHRLAYPASSRTAENRVRLSERLAKLLEVVNDATKRSIADPGRFGNLIARTRNELTHVSASQDIVENAPLHDAARLLYYVTVAAMLCESGKTLPAAIALLDGQKASQYLAHSGPILDGLDAALAIAGRAGNRARARGVASNSSGRRRRGGS